MALLTFWIVEMTMVFDVVRFVINVVQTRPYRNIFYQPIHLVCALVFLCSCDVGARISFVHATRASVNIVFKRGGCKC